ncbi:hypothetical protein [Tenacibaculum sp. 190524A05c]|uniref:hypothetical protein n=1 Tax=Tenacibaculum platacis TaxID=3137852 RepID=UPI0032B12E8D
MKKSKTELKTYFQSGDKPTQQNYEDLIDSFIDAQQPTGDANRTFIINANGEVGLGNQQSDWNQSDSSQPNFINNKPIVKVPTRNYVLKSDTDAGVDQQTFTCVLPTQKSRENDNGQIAGGTHYYMAADFIVVGKTVPDGEVSLEFSATAADGSNTIFTEKIGFQPDNITNTLVGTKTVLPKRFSAVRSFFGDTLISDLKCKVTIDVPESKPTIIIRNVYFGIGNVEVDWQPAFEDLIYVPEPVTTN